ncbi:MAG: chorismate mutase [Clostridiales bacterium]|jgi:monofunctional chorismate mutase|nr:chorismate mutase [Clostridiales bacterium]
MKELESLRGKINKLDRQIMRLLDERFRVCREIGRLKAASSSPVLDEGREKAILEKISAANLKYSREIAGVYRRIMEESRGIQQRVLNEEDN